MNCDEIKTASIGKNKKQHVSRLNSVMKDWDKKSSVRVSTRNYNDLLISGKFNFFRMDLVPLSYHPAFDKASLKEQRVLQVLQLSRYLYSTEIMESKLVNPALLALQNLDYISSEMKVNAWKIYTDEAYHSLMVAELREEIHNKTGVIFPQLPYPVAQKLILDEVNKLPLNLRNIGLICVVAVNETLITANLLQARDEQLFPSVKRMLVDHARDEAVHSIFFTDVFSIIWNNLSNENKAVIRYLIPMTIKNFLGLDAKSLKYDVLQFGFNDVDAENIANEATLHYLEHTKTNSSSIEGTFKMLGKTTFFEEYDCSEMFDGIKIPELFINKFTNLKE